MAREVQTIQVENMRKSADIYVHADRDIVYDLGMNLELTGEALSLFKFACSDVRLTLEVDTNTGLATITHVDGRKVT